LSKLGIVAFAFGVPYTIESNKIIATIAQENSLEHKAPIYTQSDIVINETLNINYIEGDQPPTLRIAREAIKWAKKNDLDGLLIIAAAPHINRAMRDMKMAIKEAKQKIILIKCLDVYNYPKAIWFCSNSSQTRTKSKMEWYKREIILKILPFFIYKRIAN
jgi:hypothetical protein